MTQRASSEWRERTGGRPVGISVQLWNAGKSGGIRETKQAYNIYSFDPR